MTASAFEDGPIRPVFSPMDVQGVRKHLDRQRSLMARLLLARDAVLESLHSGARRVVELAGRYRLGFAVAAARRALGWLSGATSTTSRVLRTPGIRPALVWVSFTEVGQRTIGSAARRAGRAVMTVTRWGVQGIEAFLRLFGRRGDRAARWLETRARQVHRRGAAALSTGCEFAGALLAPSGVLAQGVSSLAKARALSAVLRHLLPGRWSRLGHVLGLVVTVPAWVRHELVQMVSAQWKTDQPSSPEAGGDDPTPPTSPVALRLPFEQMEEDLPRAVNDVHRSTVRYPAKRPNKKRR